MKKLLIVITSCLMTLLMGMTFIACKPRDDSNMNFDKSQEYISMAVSATSEKIKIEIDSDSKDVGNGVGKVVAMEAYKYFEADAISGLSQDKVDSSYDGGTEVADYTLGTKRSIEIDRYKDGYDQIYSKFYIVSEDKVLKGPIYATDIEQKMTGEPTFNIKSKKGLLGEDIIHFKELGCSYATVNFDIANLICPNEIFVDGDPVEIEHPTDAVKFDSNGKTFYFKASQVAAFDNMVKSYYNAGAHVTAIVYSSKNSNEETFPQSMTYAPWSTQGTILMGLNTSNQYGFEYYVAMMEFLADRYTQEGLPYGYIGNFVIGNEIDYAKDYNRISEYHADLDTYMEEYSRLLRLSNLAVKKYDKDITVCTSLTQSWAERGYYFPNNSVQAYVPKKMIEWLNKKSKVEGDYDWGISPHCYTYGLAQAEIFLHDTVNGKNVGMTNDIDTTTKLTFSNLELLDEYLNREEMKVNGETVRKVYLTESGVSTLNYLSNKYTDEQKEKWRNAQAGAIAATWYKISQLDSIVAYNYYRLYDHSEEIPSEISFGLIDINKNPKPSYEVYKYIDTQYSEYVAKDYLEYLTYKDVNGKIQSVENGGIKSYLDLLDIFGTGYDFSNFDWEKATPVSAEPIYEWEDKIPLPELKFESKNFLYDGTEKRIEATNIPEGIEVTYSEEPVLTEIGTKDIIATFTKDSEVVARRKATISVSRLATNKTVYELGEKIFVTTVRDGIDLHKQAWVGIFKKGATPGNTQNPDEISYYYYYFNNNNDSYTRTVCIQDQIKNKEDMPAGEYVIYYFTTDLYEYLHSVEITILPEGESGSVNLSNVSFLDKEVSENGEEQSLTITGELPAGVTVEYVNNTLASQGSIEACAIFKKEGVELERRYAVLTILASDFKQLTTNKTTYVEGVDEILVTAIAPESSNEQTWWVGMYLTGDTVEEAESIYWYYVKDATHSSGDTVNIKEQQLNATRVDLKDLPVGKYKIVLFNTSGYTVETQVEIEIVKAVIEKGIETDKTTYTVGEAIMVTAYAPDDSANETWWVGIYRKDADVTAGSIRWYYVNTEGRASGDAVNIKEVDIGDGVGELPAGEYKIVLFNTSGYTVETQVEIEIVEPLMEKGIKTDKATYMVGEAIMVTAYAPADSASSTWWVGLYLTADDVTTSDPGSIYWYYVKDGTHNSGDTVNIKLQTPNTDRADLMNLPVGKYKLVLFNTSGYTVETQVEIEIIEQIESGIKTDKTTYAVGEEIYVTAYAPADSANSTWWVGMYLTDDTVETAESIYWYYVKDGTHNSGDKVNIKQQQLNATRVDLKDLPAGTYKIVLFNTSGYTVETQVEITITAA